MATYDDTAKAYVEMQKSQAEQQVAEAKQNVDSIAVMYVQMNNPTPITESAEEVDITPESLGFKLNKNIGAYRGLTKERVDELETKLSAVGFKKEKAGAGHGEYEFKHSHPGAKGFNVHVHSRFGSSGDKYAWIQHKNLNEEVDAQ